PPVPSLMQSFGLDPVEDFAVAVRGGDRGAEVILGPAALVRLEHALHRAARGATASARGLILLRETLAQCAHIRSESVHAGGVPVTGEQCVQVLLLSLCDGGGLCIDDRVDAVFCVVLAGGEVAVAGLELLETIPSQNLVP